MSDEEKGLVVETLPTYGLNHGDALTKESVPLIVDPSLPSSVGLAKSHFLQSHPLGVFVSWGSLRDWVIVTYQGRYYCKDFSRSKKLTELIDNLKDAVVELDPKDRFQVVGFTQEIFNYQPYDQLAQFNPHYEPTEESRMVIIDKEKEFATMTQYPIACVDLTDMFIITATDDPTKIQLKLRPDMAIEDAFYNPSKY